MIRLLINKRGQSTLEYAILVVIVILALIGIQSYLKRGISGRMRESTDQIGEQFEAGVTTYNFVTESSSITHENQTAWGSNTNYEKQEQQRTGWENIGNLEEASWSM